MNNAAAAIDNGRRAARSLAVAAAVRRAGTAARRCARTSWCNAGRRRSLASKNETRATGSRTVATARGIERDGYSDLTGARRGRLRGVSLSEPVVVDAHRLELGLYRPHHHHHLLD